LVRAAEGVVAVKAEAEAVAGGWVVAGTGAQGMVEGVEVGATLGRGVEGWAGVERMVGWDVAGRAERGWAGVERMVGLEVAGRAVAGWGLGVVVRGWVAAAKGRAAQGMEEEGAGCKGTKTGQRQTLSGPRCGGAHMRAQAAPKGGTT
jgi:hypothetical protein